jgi:hypothetical protein
MARLVSSFKAALDRRIGIEEYLVWSTVISVLMFVPLKGTFQVGYAIVLLNAMAMLVFDQLRIHRNHMLAILALAGFSAIGAQLSGTPLTAPLSQILGISVLSIYFFSALTTFGLSVSRWMELYMRAALALAILGIPIWMVVRALHIGDGRFTAIYSEPSYFIYVTLPALGYCINCFVNERRYGWETLIFLITYALADSALGFLGLLLIGFFTYAPRLKGWQILVGAVAACTLIAGLYVVSDNIRVRADEMITAIAKQDLSGAGNSTFAFLSNIYVTSQSFQAHPLTGIGIGGYVNAYEKYIGDITGAGIPEYITSQELNRDDASSMFLRVAAELGVPGLVLLIGFLIVCARVRGQPYVTIRNTLLPYLIVRMSRMGHYFTVELYFFVGLYLLNYLNYRAAHRPDAAPGADAPERLATS